MENALSALVNLKFYKFLKNHGRVGASTDMNVTAQSSSLPYLAVWSCMDIFIESIKFLWYNKEERV